MTRPLRILISAGEASGDALGAGLARALAARRPGIELFGMGGDEMAEAGVALVQHASEVAVVGIVEVLAHLPAIRRAMARLEEALDARRPDLVVAVDFPDFNLRLAARARARGVPVVYFVSPQVWAWRQGRVSRIKALVRRMLVLFPFEVGFYERAGVPVTFVGHPAVEFAKRESGSGDDLIRRLGLDPSHPVVALLPGSRRSEVARLLPPILGAAELLRRRRPELQFVIPKARTLPDGLLEGEVRAYGLEGVRVHAGDYPAVLGLAAAGIVASGTATLDAALARLPIVVVYRMRPLTYALGRWLVHVEHVALPNLVAGRRVVPELLQGDCVPERIAAAAESFLDGSERAPEVRRGLEEVRAKLGPVGAFDRAAAAVLAEARDA